MALSRNINAYSHEQGSSYFWISPWPPRKKRPRALSARMEASLPERLVIDPRTATFDDLAPAARVLLEGGLVAGPTDTFYAIMALVDNHEALNTVMRLKGEEERQNKPSLILLDQEPRVRCYAREVPEEAEGLMESFWPGPLTLLFLAHTGLHQCLVGPARTVGLRVEGMPSVRKLVRMVDRGLTGTSANRSGGEPATTADQVIEVFGDDLAMVIDGGPTAGGSPSTIIDVSLGVPRVLRDGGLPMSSLKQACPILRF
ncbi:threonylcarbamoyl-AMP synthase [Deltaproteobacteria bacterium Smac51]|nr:threonylcarbamoyl-AMP synthase [Deltaproteobacteria bacterium Smac51]